MTTPLFETAANQSLLNSGNIGLAIAPVVPGTTAAEGKKQVDSGEGLQGLAWKQLTKDLFGTSANENHLKGNPMAPLPSM